MTTKNWATFFFEAKNVLSQTSSNGKYFMELIVEPSFDNPVKILIKWRADEARVIWVKTTWYMLADRDKFDSQPEMRPQMRPTFSYKNGTIERKHIEPVWASLASLSLRPHLEPTDSIVLDGTHTTFTVGRHSDYMTYNWHLLPNSWEPLESIVEAIIQLEKRVVFAV